jgi:hypothetical protein
MRAARVVVAVSLALGAVGVTAQPCLACTCAPATPHEYARRADVVFTGRVVKIIRPLPDNVMGDDFLRVRFDVSRTYKGRARAHRVVRTNESEGPCGFTFSHGARYTVFAYRHKGRPSTNLCSGTKRGRINPDRYGFDRHQPRPVPASVHLS